MVKKSIKEVEIIEITSDDETELVLKKGSKTRKENPKNVSNTRVLRTRPNAQLESVSSKIKSGVTPKSTKHKNTTTTTVTEDTPTDKRVPKRRREQVRTKLSFESDGEDPTPTKKLKYEPKKGKEEVSEAESSEDLEDRFEPNTSDDEDYAAKEESEEEPAPDTKVNITEIEDLELHSEEEDDSEKEEEDSSSERENNNNKTSKRGNNDKKNNKKDKNKENKEKKKKKRSNKKDKYIHVETLLDDEDLERDHRSVPVKADPPETLSECITMLPFQRESLAWMSKQEDDNRWRGGILADDMGMGKTLQAIALILKKSSPDENIKTTLVVSPVVALSQWRLEIAKFSKPGALKVAIYHGADRITDRDELKSCDVIITSYSVIETEFRYQNYGYKRKGELIKKESVLHGIKWYRVILDEAHSIKDRTCSTARAAFNLDAQFRWALTGTPLQNRIGELLSLVRYLQLTPYSYYYCNSCECKSLNWSFTKYTCNCCGHSAMKHFAWWNKNVLNPIKNYGMDSPKSEKAMKVLKLILQQIMLRRTKVEKAADLCLPPRIIRIRKDQLDQDENDFYESLYTQSKACFNNFVEEGTILNNYAHVFDLLLRLRQAVDHPYLVLHSKEREGDLNMEYCGVCHEVAEDPIISKCKHVFCRMCISNYVELSSTKSPGCPKCLVPLTIDLKQKTLTAGDGNNDTTSKDTPKKTKNNAKGILKRIDLTNWRTSTKIEALMEELTRTQERDPNAKTLVFSQFVNFLDLIEWRLKMAGFGCVKLDGRMNMTQKNLAIDKFNNDPNTTVFLISLKAGGLALNLTIASYAFLMDPWWNPAAEFQAVDRIYRLGQFKCISVVRFIIPNTIEDRIIQLQEKKRLLFESTVGMDNDALARLSVQDLKFLFH